MSEKIVIFDMDGVLIDSEPFYYWKLENFLILQGYQFSKKCLDSLVGESSKKTFSILKAENPSFYETEIEYKAVYKLYSKEIKCDYQKLKNPHVNELLDALKQMGYRLALASSSPRFNIQQVLKELDIYDYFEVIASGDDFHESKPNPAIYNYVAKTLQVEPQECFVIEDSYYGITAAKRAGMNVIVKKDDRYGFDQSGGDYFISDLLEALKIIKKNILVYFTNDSELL